MSVILVTLGAPNPDGQEAFGRYAQGAGPLIGKAGGKPLRKMKLLEKISGDISAAAVSMAEFPSLEAAKSVFDSPEYAALIPDRNAAFASLTLLLLEDA